MTQGQKISFVEYRADNELKFFIDSAYASLDQRGEPSIHGWVFASSGQDITAVFAQDESQHFPASHGWERPDVAAAYPECPTAHFSGFHLKLPRLAGPASLLLYAQTNDGLVREFCRLQLAGPEESPAPRASSPADSHPTPAAGPGHGSTGVRKKILVIDGRILSRNLTGTERYIFQIIDSLRQLPSAPKFEIRVLVWTQPAIILPGISYCPRRHLEEVRAADVFFKTFPPNEDVYLEEMAAARRCVFLPHDLIFYHHPDYARTLVQHLDYARNLRAALYLSDVVIAISENGRQGLIGQMGLPPERVARIYHGVLPPSQLGPDERQLLDREMPAMLGHRPFILCVSTDYPHKNLDRLVEAHATARKELAGVGLVIVGSSSYVHARPAATKEGLFQFGHVNEPTLRWLYEHARAFVFPSLYEGFGFPPLEAMALGIPVVSSDASCLPEICGDAALYFSARSVPSLTRALVRICTDESLRAELASKGYRRSAQFSWARTAQATLEILLDKNSDGEAAVARKQSILQQHYSHNIFDRLLLLVTHVRFFPVGAGNELVIWNLIRHLKARGYQIAVILTDLDRTRLSDVQRYEILRHADLLYEVQPGDEQYCPPDLSPFADRIPNEAALERWRGTERSFCPDITLAATALVTERLNPQVVIAEYIWFSRILPIVPEGILRVIHLHDKFSNKHKQVAAFGIEDSLSLTEEEEKVFLDRADLALSIQSEETEQFAALGSSCKIITVGCAMDPVPVDPAPEEEPGLVVIVASDNRLNRHCLKWFLDRIWPSVLKRHGHARLVIAGHIGSTLASPGAVEKVEFRGYVDDLDAFYRQAALVVNPVFAGTGLKIKTIEALTHGKALIAAPEGVAGLPAGAPPYYRVARDEPEWIGQLSRLLSNDPERRQLAASARAAARELFAADNVYRELLFEFNAAMSIKAEPVK